MEMTKKQYKDYVKQVSPASPLVADMARAFVSGGLICTVGQVFSLLYRSMGLSQQTAGTLTSVTMIFLGALLTALNVYDDLARFSGAGTVIPITGFATSVASPAMEFRSEGLILGVGAKMFTVAGPVLVYGILSSAAYGLILWILQRM